MTDQEKFEQWVRSRKTIMLPLTPDEDGEYYSSSTNSAYQAYLAAKQDSAAEIAQLQSDNLKLREALELLTDVCIAHIGADYNDEIHRRYLIAKEALASTPAQSLQAHDDEVIERCAVSSLIFREYEARTRSDAIRKLKGK